MKQTDTGWYVELQCDIQPDRRLRVCGHARSYVETLYQLADTAPDVIDALQRRAKRADAEQKGSAA